MKFASYYESEVRFLKRPSLYLPVIIVAEIPLLNEYTFLLFMICGDKRELSFFYELFIYIFSV